MELSLPAWSSSATRAKVLMRLRLEPVTECTYFPISAFEVKEDLSCVQ